MDTKEPKESKLSFEAALTELKAVSENGTAADIKPATEKLQAASYKMAELLYKAASPDGAASEGSANGAANGATNGKTEQAPPADDVIDAEFKESK